MRDEFATAPSPHIGFGAGLSPAIFTLDRVALAGPLSCLASSGEGDGRAPTPARPPSGSPLHADRRPVGIVADILIRATGVAGILAAIAMFTWLYRMIHAASANDPSPGAYLLAGLAFLASSIGSAILVLGRHIHDRIELSERWRPRI